jgi:hypothetical protein
VGQISTNGSTTSLGDHETQEEAARAFDRAYINLHTDYTKLNFNIEDYEDVEALKGSPPHVDGPIQRSHLIV